MLFIFHYRVDIMIFFISFLYSMHSLKLKPLRLILSYISKALQMYVHWHRHTLPHITVITTSNQSNIFSQFFPVCINQSDILLQLLLYRGDTVKRDFKNVSIFRHGKSSEEWEIIPFPCFKFYCGVSLCSIHMYNSSYSLWNPKSIFQARNRWISNRTLHNSIRCDRNLLHMNFIETKHKKECN